jgi:hypothetical protein
MGKRRSTTWHDKYGNKIFEGSKIKSDRQPGYVTIVWNEKKKKFETDDAEINKIFDPAMLPVHGIVCDDYQITD